jgi:hypothetical protein
MIRQDDRTRQATRPQPPVHGIRILAEFLAELGGSDYGFVHLWLSLPASMAAERRDGVPP